MAVTVADFTRTGPWRNLWIYDVCAVADADPQAIDIARPWFEKHSQAFLSGLAQRATLARQEFALIDAIGKPRDFDTCLAQARQLLQPHGGIGNHHP
jgi:hypothetical protein